MWFRVAEVLGLPIRKAKQVISHPEFMEHAASLLLSDQREYDSRWKRDKIDYYFANLIYHLRLVMGGKDAAGKVEDYLMNFQEVKEVQQDRPTVKQVGAKIIAWAKMLGARDLRGQNDANRQSDVKAGS